MIPMSNAIVALVVIALMLVATLTWSQAAFSSLDSASQSLKQTTQTTQEVARTDINIVNVRKQGAFWEVYVLNSGKVHLAQFANWDVLVQYYNASGSYYIVHLPYTVDSNPGNNRWTVASIYSNSSLTKQEVFEPGILNPGEVLFLKLKLVPSPGSGTTNMVTVSTANGVVASAQFSG